MTGVNNRRRLPSCVSGGVKGCAGGKQWASQAVHVGIGELKIAATSTRTHCCCRVVDEKGKARNERPGDSRGICCDMTP